MNYLSNTFKSLNGALIVFAILLSIYGQAQVQQNELQTINEQVWSKFYEAFSTLNIELMKEIHRKDLIRISGNSQKISDYKSYIERQEKSFQQSKEKEETRHIELRFFERFYNKDTASERGIYKLTINKDTTTEKMYYGQFHVLQKKEFGVWKIFMDYDSNENQKIGKAEFDAARHIDNIEDW